MKRAFPAFLLVSIAVHAVVFGVLPALTRDSRSAPASVLRVTILDPVPLPAGPPEPMQQLRPPAQLRAQRSPVAVESKPRGDSPALVATLPEPRPDERHPLSLGTEVAEPVASAAPEQVSPAAVVAMAPASFNAAYLRNPPPHYPDAARRAGEQGTVTLRVLVTRNGLPASVTIERSSRSAQLDRAALEAVKAWRFTPARRATEPVESWMLVPVVFRLEGSG